MPHIRNEWWGVLSIVVSLIGCVPYFAGIISGKTKPHAFSWIIWFLLAIIAFFGQRTAGAGSGAWINGFVAVVCFVISAIALIKNEQKITKSDLVTFIAALLIIPVWLITDNALYALLLVTTIDTLAFYPTYRKSWQKPDEENPAAYLASAVQYLISVLAMDAVNWTTTLYPSWMAFVNVLFVTMVVWRRKRLKMA